MALAERDILKKKIQMYRSTRRRSEIGPKVQVLCWKSSSELWWKYRLLKRRSINFLPIWEAWCQDSRGKLIEEHTERVWLRMICWSRWFGYVGYLIGICANAHVSLSRKSRLFGVRFSDYTYCTRNWALFPLHFITPMFPTLHMHTFILYFYWPPTGLVRRGSGGVNTQPPKIQNCKIYL